jgi:hypothetical protein
MLLRQTAAAFLLGSLSGFVLITLGIEPSSFVFWAGVALVGVIAGVFVTRIK